MVFLILFHNIYIIHTYRHNDNCMWIRRHAKAWFRSRVSNYPRYKTIPRICAGPLFNLFTSGMQLRMFCRVLRPARLHLRFVVEFCAEIHDAIVGRDRSETLISRI